eukprot:CAMPEP_0115025366 /NCGR_PEP_ID=MMETSP0216-20121206/33949_1 /TAXON_ID=223996 /ORGANISM="Protocruzia adherens, Strain Boccale" /LENGTH=111 /DNA_ID=CAMNT_0002399919 /DNA_START=26 /DNA_END=357 /DNA_ORIENTATION=-
MEGPCASAFDSYLALRGIKTLHIRLEQQMKNALQVAQWLQKHPQVKQVRYPGLDDHEGKEISKKQCKGRGGSGMMSFYLKTDDLTLTRKVTDGCKLFIQAGSLGAVESLIA